MISMVRRESLAILLLTMQLVQYSLLCNIYINNEKKIAHCLL